MDSYYRAAEVEADNQDPMVFRIVVSTETRGRDRLVVKSDGWELDDYRRNPVVLFNHDPDYIIGRSPEIGIVGKRLIARVQLAEEGTSDTVDMVRALVRQKMLKGASAGFRPLEPPEIRVVDGEIQEIIVKRQTLFEFSLTPVPAVPDALALARSIGATDAVIARMFPGAAVAAYHTRVGAQLDLIRAAAGRHRI